MYIFIMLFILSYMTKYLRRKVLQFILNQLCKENFHGYHKFFSFQNYWYRLAINVLKIAAIVALAHCLYPRELVVWPYMPVMLSLHKQVCKESSNVRSEIRTSGTATIMGATFERRRLTKTEIAMYNSTYLLCQVYSYVASQLKQSSQYNIFHQDFK